MAFLETAIITAKIAQLFSGLGALSGGEINNHANQRLHELINRNTITLSSPEFSPFQSEVIDCQWINPFPEGSSASEETEPPPHVTCELFQDPNGGLPILRTHVSNWPLDKAAMVAFAFQGSDSVIVIANPDNPSVNLQTICGVGPINQWFLRGMSGWIWESGDFIDSSAASSACFNGVNEPSTITIKDPVTGLEKQFIFDPTSSGSAGNQGAFQPFLRDIDTYKIFFNPSDPDSARTLSAMQQAIQEQLRISTGKDIIVWPYMSFADPTRLLERIPLPTPTPMPTEIPVATPAAPYVEPQAQIITAIESSPQEAINHPLSNIGLELQVAGKDVVIYRENPLATERDGLVNYINALNTTVDQALLDEKYREIEDVNFWERIKSWWGGYEYALNKVETGPVNISRVLHINFSNPGKRTLVIDGLDIDGKFMRIYLPVKGNVSVHDDGRISFKNKTRFKFTALDTQGMPDEASLTIARLAEQIANYYDLGSKASTLPEVVVVPREAVPFLYSNSGHRNAITFDARSLRAKYPTQIVTLSYYDENGAQHLVPNFLLPTGMLGRAKQLLMFNNALVYEVEITLLGDLVNGNIIGKDVLSTLQAQFPSNMRYSSSFTIYVTADNIAAIPGDKLNPYEPTPLPATVTPTHTTFQNSTETITPTQPIPTPIPYELRFPQGDEIHQMDPRFIPYPTPSSYLPPSTLELISNLAETKANEWAKQSSSRAQRMRNNHAMIS